DIMRLSTEQNQLMLQSMLPQEMIEKFKLKDTALVVDTYAEVTVLFCIIDNFVEIARTISPENLLFLLNVVYSEFDRITEETGVYKIETVGEVFMGCAGCPQRVIDHADKAARCATEMMKAMPDIRNTLSKKLEENAGKSSVIRRLNIKIGLNSGKIVAGVLNTPATIRFKLFGDTVNTASRMQSLSKAGKIQISEKCYRKLVAGAEHSYYVFSDKRQVEAKGKGTLDTWFLEKVLTDKEVKRLRGKLVKKKSQIVLNEEGGEEVGEKLDGFDTTNISGKIRAKLAVSLTSALDGSSKNIMSLGSDGHRSSGSAVVFNNQSSSLSGTDPNLLRPSIVEGRLSSDSLVASQPRQADTSQNFSSPTKPNVMARRGTFMAKGTSG
ncbi:hypothetical protein TrRE_jg1570, partial [Triparma retinervis]